VLGHTGTLVRHCLIYPAQRHGDACERTAGLGPDDHGFGTPQYFPDDAARLVRPGLAEGARPG
jgi:hypothetical protein